MKKYFLLFLLFSGFSFAQYTTPNTGVNWNLDSLVVYSTGVVTGSFPNYNLINKVTVSANDKLTILPGSVLTITGSTSGFEVNGSFIAKGTSSDSIIFTSTIPDSTGEWDGIRFTDPSIDSLCKIDYARIEYALYAIRCVGASPSVSNSYIFKCSRGFNLSSSFQSDYFS